MDNQQDQTRDKSYQGYDTPGEDRIIQSTSEAVPSPSTTSEQRLTTPDAFIGGEVQAKPGSANPAINETKAYDTGEASTADLLRARESAEEEHLRVRGIEMYEDQPTQDDQAGMFAPDVADVTQDNDPEEAVYQQREFGHPTEPSELDMIGGSGINLPSGDDDER